MALCLCGCGREASKKYIRGHAPRSNRPDAKGRPLVPDGFHYCSRCKQIKSVVDFSKSKWKVGGLEDACKPCHQERCRQHRGKDRTYTNLYAKLHRYRKVEGFNSAVYDQALKRQNGCCAICKQPFENSRDLHIDHCHLTNQFRGLLCSKCNVGLGYFRDNVGYLQSAIAYLVPQ